MILFQNRNEKNLIFTIRIANQVKVLYGDDRDAHSCSIECNILYQATEVECRGFSFSTVCEDHEVVKDVDEMCMKCPYAKDCIENHSGSCSFSSLWLEKSDASKGMESNADMRNPSACNKHLMELAQFLTVWIPWVCLIRYPGKCFPGDSFRMDKSTLLI